MQDKDGSVAMYSVAPGQEAPPGSIIYSSLETVAAWDIRKGFANLIDDPAERGELMKPILMGVIKAPASDLDNAKGEAVNEPGQQRQ